MHIPWEIKCFGSTLSILICYDAAISLLGILVIQIYIYCHQKNSTGNFIATWHTIKETSQILTNGRKGQ